jgi:hypothetical protein
MYYGKGGWSLNPTEAREFATPLEAVSFVIQRQIGNAELVAKTGKSERSLPLNIV